MQYRFFLKDNDQKAYRLLVWFFIFLHIVAASFIGLKGIYNNTKISPYLFLAIYFLIFAGFSIFRKSKNAFEIASILLAFFYAFFWFYYIGMLAMLIFVALFIFIIVVKQKKATILVTQQGIHIVKVFSTLLLSWEKLENVILKDNILTIDCRSNKLIQIEITTESETIDEKLFNRFCGEQLQNNL